MSKIRPFKAVTYNLKKVHDLSKLVCPPYDVISDDEALFLRNMSPHNFIHLLLAKDKKGDNKDNNKYTRARDLYNQWIDKGILTQDKTPGIYFYKQEYTFLGQRRKRVGFISLMELQDESDSNVFPHENTHSAAVDDRLQLWQSLDANLSCIFVCYSDKQRKIEKIFTRDVLSSSPILELTDKDNIKHILWKLEDEHLIKEMNSTIAGQHLFIADGHHRYKVAMAYRQIRMARKKNISGEEPFNYVMTYFTNIDSKDLQIFPIHRIVKRLPKRLDFLEDLFRIDKIKHKNDLAVMLARAGRNEHAFGLYSREGIRLLRLKNKMLINKYVDNGSVDYKSLDATILKYFIFDRIGVRSDDIIYTENIDEAAAMVDNGQADVCFIMNPVKISQLKAIALNGERMPPKTTYFYPKVLSGLTVYKM